jgi:tetratricopeptide (TPR) repeat protein
MRISFIARPLAVALVWMGLASAQQPKSQAEAEALQKIVNATDPAEQIQAVDELLQKFKDTEYKAIVLGIQASAAFQMNDRDKVIVYGEKALEANPQNYQVMVMMAQALAQGTREFDLDREEKLARVEKLATDAIAVLDVAQKPNPQVTDEQWTQEVTNFKADATVALGMADAARKSFDDAITHFQAALVLRPDQVTTLRLAQAYNNAGKYPDALKLADEVLADSQLNPALRPFAEQEKAKAEKGAGGQ